MARQLSPEITKKVKAYVDLLKRDIPVDSVYVFGSHAKGSARPESDIDVAIISPAFNGRSIENGSLLSMKLWESPYKNMDIIGYSPEYFESEDSPIIHEIKKHGVLIL